MKLLSRSALLLVLIGAVNWGLVGILRVDLIYAIFGNSIAAKILYTLVGISGIYIIVEKLLGKIFSIYLSHK